MIIDAPNPDLTYYEQTSLSTPVYAGGTSLLVKNTDKFANTNRILIGALGAEKSEITSVSGSPTPTTITTPALKFPHSTDDPVYQLQFDQIKFYKSSLGVNGTYSLLVTLDIDTDNVDLLTSYNDTTGLPGDYYKITFYNSVTLEESDFSDPIAGAGSDVLTAGAVINEVMEEVGDPKGTNTSRNIYYSWLNEVNYALQKRMRKPYDFLKRDLVVNVTAGQGVPYPTDVLHFDTVEYSYNNGGTTRVYNPTPVYYDEWILLVSEPNFEIANDEVEKIYFDDVNQLVQTYPKFATNQTGTWTFHHWKKFTHIDSDGDPLETIDPQVYKMYLKGMYYRKKSAAEERFLAVSDRWLSDYNVELAQVSKYDRKNIGKPQNFRIQYRPSLRGYRGYRYR